MRIWLAALVIMVFVVGPYLWGLLKLIYKFSMLRELDLPARYGAKSWVLITGPSRGQGRYLALEFARRGFNLILLGSVRTGLVVEEIKRRWPTIQVHWLEKDFSRAVEPDWWSDVVPLFNGERDISVVINNVGQRSASRPSHAQSLDAIHGSIITGTFPQVRLTQLALDWFQRRPGTMHCAIIFNTAQCQHVTYGLSQYWESEIAVPYLSVYEAANAFGYYHANSIIKEYGDDPRLDLLHVTPGAVLTEKTQAPLADVLFSVPAEEFVANILVLLGNWQGQTCAYWGHELSPLLISLAPWLKAGILEKVGISLAKS